MRLSIAILFLCSTAISATPPSSTFYIRNTAYARREPLLVFRGLVEGQALDWLKLQAGASEGLVSGRQAQWGYKLEATTSRFLDYFAIAARIAKMNTYLPGTSLENIFGLRATMAIPLKPWTFLASSGVIVQIEGENSSPILPVFDGKSKAIPAISLGAKHESEDEKQAWLLRLGNFDVFDVYPLRTPFVQLDYEQSVNEDIKLFTYGRYRMDGAIDKLYAFYFTLGVVVKLGADS